jgi:uncharacterized membrane protein YebE (DUF533 family)
MFDPERLLGQMLGGALGGAFGGRTYDKRHKHKHHRHQHEHSRGSALGGIMPSVGTAQVGLGLLGVAMAAYEHYSQKSPAAASPVTAPQPAVTGAAMPPPPPPPPQTAMQPPAPPSTTRAMPMLDMRRQEAALLIRAMIAAAAADGLIDADERAAIVDRARAAGDDADTLTFLQQELDNPVDAAQLAAQTPRGLTNGIYAAAVLAIDIDTERERQFLDTLAGELGLDADKRAALHREIGIQD